MIFFGVILLVQVEQMSSDNHNDKSLKKNEKEDTKICIPVEVEIKDGSSRAAYAASLQMIFRHVADFHMTVVDIISEKYNIPVEEIISTVTSHSNYKNMVVDENLHRLSAVAAAVPHNELLLNKKDEKSLKQPPPPAKPPSIIKKTEGGEKKMKIKIKSVPKKIIGVDGVEQCD